MPKSAPPTRIETVAIDHEQKDAHLRDQIQALLDERDQLKRILESMPNAIYVVGQNYQIEYANPALTRLFGAYDNRKCHEYLHGLVEPCGSCEMSRVFQGETLRWDWRGPDGRTYDLFDFPLQNADGSISKVEVFHDITALTKARNHLELAAQLAQVGYWDWSLENHSLFWSDETYRCFGYEPGAIEPSYEMFLDSIHPDDRDSVDAAVQFSAANATDYFVDFRYFDCHRQLRTGRAVGRVDCDTEGKPLRMHGAMQDISSQKDIENRLEFLSNHDELTGLANRHLFRLYFDQARTAAERNNQRLALLLIDLDHFKAFNDNLGHSIGDQILLDVSNRLKRDFADEASLCRFGGDEFLLLSSGFNELRHVEEMAATLLDSLAAPICIDGHELSSTLSIGVALWPDDACDFDGLLKCADVAMYRAKSEGRNTTRFFTEEMNEQAKRFHVVRNALSHALARHELELFYQPQIDLSTGGIIGVEALLRWHRKGQAQVSPAEFIPVAEESGMIVAIGEWVLNQACQQASRWQQQGLPIRSVAVNLSAIQFKRSNIEDTIVRALSLSGLNPACLDLELTESILLEDANSVLHTVQNLRKLGVKLSIDDFGTGYSSLAYLRRFSVNTLKIDQSFIRDMFFNGDDCLIVKAIIDMAHSLKLKVLAEGVETEETASLLRGFGCEQVQGYLYAHPMPADAFATWLKARQPLR